MNPQVVPQTPTVPQFKDREWQIIDIAKAQWHRDGECEIEDTAEVSEGSENGAYVHAWVWVSFEGTHLDKGIEVS